MTQLSVERYEAEARSDHRTYARDHNYAEWCHYIRFHVMGEINYSSSWGKAEKAPCLLTVVIRKVS